ncbi:MAG: sulfatase-like hydrolase/transferase [Granulosicoccus sp.]|nr:sulfatase-like hydrolase/transferase [Granulosicoccus sp.]
MKKKQNFLFIIADQLRADYLSCTGHPVVKTPYIDSIAARGTLFKRFYVANPVCMPNRAAMMTGRHSSVSGVRHNGIPLPLEANTFVDVLRYGGYDTALIGKSHLQCTDEGEPELGPNPAAHEPLSDASRRVPGNYNQEKASRWASKGASAMDLPYYGFSHVDLLTGHGDRGGGALLADQRAALDDPDSLWGAANQFPHDYTCPQAVRTRIPEEHYSTFWIRDRAKDYLAKSTRHDSPFFAFVSFPDPHHPFTPPGKYWDMYDPDDMVLPESFGKISANPPPHLKWLCEHGEPGKAAYGAALVNEQQAREAMALTCGMISMIDDAVGAILTQLEASGLAENTIVIFTSDHGDFLGDHGMILKGPMHYQSTTRVPFIWAGSDNTAPTQTERLASSVDIGPTILNCAALKPFNGMQGRNLFESPPRHSVLIEDDGNRISLGFESAPRVRTLVTERYRMSIYQGQSWGELYDLVEDPGEIENLWDEPKLFETRASLQFELIQHLAHACDSSPWPESLA